MLKIFVVQRPVEIGPSESLTNHGDIARSGRHSHLKVAEPPNERAAASLGERHACLIYCEGCRCFPVLFDQLAAARPIGGTELLSESGGLSVRALHGWIQRSIKLPRKPEMMVFGLLRVFG
ncbi:hypothetical protein THAOC_19022 [Thalassiosira oceanica]|uniref:Uncharacterized protein n=1 Tax=Thalassiosira oceanica TaxID=159749 RepID=K0SQF8_THAOC|nr:hypothetical protein THAOC_19022 [Thalassiosira oceanica]|eukprot:EJK60592.1 hypothetical protein THAOC_19022 [Thalassiosira oceanica]